MLRLLPALCLLFAACDIFTARVPCAVDSECTSTDRCIDGFCGPDDGGGAGEGEGGEGEGEGAVESHPLRGTVCTDVAAPSVADPALRCSIFSVFDELCTGDGDCGDPSAPFCTDVGAGPRICALTASLTRHACPDAPGDPNAVTDATVDGAPFACVEGSLLYVPTLVCSSSAVAFSGPTLLGGDLFVRMNSLVGEAAPCTTMSIVRFGPTAIGGSFLAGPDPVATQGSDVQAPLTAIPLDNAVAIFGDYVHTGTHSIQTLAANELKRVLGDVVATNNDALTTINLFNLVEVGGSVVLGNNPALNELINTAPVRIGGDLTVTDCPLLPRCALDPLVAVTAGTVSITGVDESASCP